MIKLTGIKKHFIVGGERLEVIRGLDLVINRGEFVSIMGKSGSGKSTLLNLIGCLDAPSEGRYSLFDRDVSSLPDNELSKVRNRHIGFVFQSFNLIARNTARKNIEKPLIYQGTRSKERKIKVDVMLEKMGLTDRAEHRPSQLSGGQQQRVAIARALVTDPDLIIADEPTGNLDSSTSREVMDTLRKICNEGKTIVMVTHDASLTEFTDRVIQISDGRICRE